MPRILLQVKLAALSGGPAEHCFPRRSQPNVIITDDHIVRPVNRERLDPAVTTASVPPLHSVTLKALEPAASHPLAPRWRSKGLHRGSVHPRALFHTVPTPQVWHSERPGIDKPLLQAGECARLEKLRPAMLQIGSPVWTIRLCHRVVP